ncbi:MAG: metallophosphoesterase family protein [Candidatus Fimenecus sp.]
MRYTKCQKIFGALLAAVLLVCTLPLCGFAETEENALQFHNGKFKILILSDVQDTDTPQKETTAFLEAALDSTNPDLVVLLGDNTAGWWKGVDKEKTQAAVDAVAKPIDSRGVPFALVFGNHDHEGLCSDENGMTEEEAKQFLLSCFQKYETCLTVAGEDLTGLCNYNLPIKSSDGQKIAYNLWFMDSNPYTPESEGGGYGYVHPDQIAWYEKTAAELKAQNGGETVPAMLFQHIVVPEVYDMLSEVERGTAGAVRGSGIWKDKYYTVSDAVYQGALNEGPCPSNKNGGQFDSWLQTGDIVAAFFGHDHVNDFAGVYKGIHLVATPAVTFYSYGNRRGVRTITLDEENPSTFTSEILTFADLTDLKVTNLYKANHGYYEYKYRFLPIALGVLGGAAVLAAGAFGLRKGWKKRKGRG